MSRSAKAEAALALHRFGMGPRPGSIAAIEADPRGALLAELDRPAISELAAANLPSSAKAYRAVTDAFAKRQAKAIVAKKEQDAKRQQMAEASAMMEGAAQGQGQGAGEMGANSTGGINRTRGLNENLAREILELHTLGVRSGYTQDDVIGFANILTGWTLVPPGDNPEHGGEFTFNPRLHEPGAQKVLGKSYEDETVEQGRAVLRDLAANPATASHVATKLARHFVADTPPPALVEKMARAFLDTGGDLKQVARVMVASDEAWTQPPAKLKQPGEWVVGMVRATGLTQAAPRRYTDGQGLLGEPLWRPPSPKGFPDDEASWIDGMGRRLDVANNFAERIAGRTDPQDVIETVLGSQVSPEVKQAVGRAESRQQALVLLFMSAEFQRR